MCEMFLLNYKTYSHKEWSVHVYNSKHWKIHTPKVTNLISKQLHLWGNSTSELSHIFSIFYHLFPEVLWNVNVFASGQPKLGLLELVIILNGKRVRNQIFFNYLTFDVVFSQANTTKYKLVEESRIQIV